MESGKQVNILHIRVSHSAISTQLSYSQSVIIERINVFFGSQLIHRLRIHIYSETKY